MPPFSDRDLEAFLDETLSSEASAQLEQALRDNAALRERLAAMLAGRDRGDHSLGAVWQRGRLSCPDRSLLGAYLLDVLDADERLYVERHLELVGCRYCRANLDDLRQGREAESADDLTIRRRRLFQSSVGRLRK